MKVTFSAFMLVCGVMLSGASRASDPECQGRFVNPITDICWQCLFPLSVGNIQVAAGSEPDTENPSSPLQICPAGVLYRIGFAIGYWEPFTLTDVTRAPYCMVNLGGASLSAGQAGRKRQGRESTGAFYHVHWCKNHCSGG